MPEPTRSLSLKTLAVLGAFTSERPRLTLSEISRACDLPLTTTHRIVADLVAWGAVEPSRTGGYQVGLRLWETAVLAPRGVPLREAALPFMEDLYEGLHENVQLAVREGFEVVYVERLGGRDSVRVLTRVGGRFAMHATGVGLVLLAHAPDAVQEEVLAGPLRRWTAGTVTDPRRLRSLLAEVRRTGVAISDRQVTTDALSVACPVRGADDAVVAALSVVVHASTSPVTVEPAVRSAARSISRVLGSAMARRSPSGVAREEETPGAVAGGGGPG